MKERVADALRQIRNPVGANEGNADRREDSAQEGPRDSLKLRKDRARMRESLAFLFNKIDNLDMIRCNQLGARSVRKW
jgi:hypothetical protein